MYNFLFKIIQYFQTVFLKYQNNFFKVSNW
jgi:hypothetical protein